MGKTRWAGAGIMVLGALLALSFLSTRVNPDLNVVDLGLLMILLGAIILASTVYEKMPSVGRALYLGNTGWVVMSAGLLVGLYGYLLANQVACTCPATGPCNCGALYGLMASSGALSALAGGILVVVSRFVGRTGPDRHTILGEVQARPRGVAAQGLV